MLRESDEAVQETVSVLQGKHGNPVLSLDPTLCLSWVGFLGVTVVGA